MTVEDGRRYWNPVLETLVPERHLALELKNLRKLIQYAKNHSVFYQEKYKDISPEEVIDIETVRRLPLIDKEDLRKAQEGKGPFPYGEILGVDLKEVTDFRQTSGTTGRPVYVPESYESWQWRVEVWCHILWMAGFRESRPRLRSLLVTMSMWPSGRAIMRRKSWAARWFPAAPSIPEGGSTR